MRRWAAVAEQDLHHLAPCNAVTATPVGYVPCSTVIEDIASDVPETIDADQQRILQIL